jgi:RNA polymerase sigma-70 factor (ECF subfamily)
MSAEDLLQEAFLRALNEDGRKCPVGIDVVKFLAEAMRSIANGEGEKIRAVAVLVPIGTHDNGDDQAYQVADGTPSTEDRLVSNEETVQRRQDLLAIFEDDEAARDIVDGTIEGMSTDEMRELTGLGKTAYDSKRKLIRRRIDKRYPDGWKP